MAKKTKQITEEQFEKLANELLSLNEKKLSFLDKLDGCSYECSASLGDCIGEDEDDEEEFSAQLAEPNYDDTIYLITTHGRTKVSIFVSEAYGSGWVGEKHEIDKKELLSKLSSDFEDAVIDHLNEENGTITSFFLEK